MILWDENKNIKLKLERNISFEQISEIILEEMKLDKSEQEIENNITAYEKISTKN